MPMPSSLASALSGRTSATSLSSANVRTPLYAAAASTAAAWMPSCAGFPNSSPSAVVFQDRKSTRLNSSHLVISYAVFCLKKKFVDLLERDDAAGAEQVAGGVLAV